MEVIVASSVSMNRLNVEIEKLLEKKKLTTHIMMLLNSQRRWHYEQQEKAAQVLGFDLRELVGTIKEQPPNVVLVKFAPQEMRRLQRLAARQLRPLDNLIRWLVLQQLLPGEQ